MPFLQSRTRYRVSPPLLSRLTVKTLADATSGFAETRSSFSGQTVTDRFIYCTKLEQEFKYCEFVYAVSAIFLLPVSAHALVRLLLLLFCNLLRQISRLSTFTVVLDVKRRWLTICPVFAETGSSFNGQTVADRTIHCIEVE